MALREAAKSAPRRHRRTGHVRGMAAAAKRTTKASGLRAGERRREKRRR